MFGDDAYLVAFVREMDKVVYGIRCEFGNQKLKQDHHLDVAPMLSPGSDGSLWYNISPYLPWETRDGEVAMYDFNQTVSSPECGVIEVHGTKRRVFGDWIIEGIGPCVGEGNLLHPTDELTTNTDPHTVGLVSVTLADGTLEYAGSAYALAHPHDLNRDGAVDIEDVAAAINAILLPGQALLENDATVDGRVDIDDVNAVINALLAKP
ncbi:MAG: hypothetical protein IJT30_09760 [Muribaculaceae bacterium]|nr:hypothetical protein [Muribaculaceae bacterium]